MMLEMFSWCQMWSEADWLQWCIGLVRFGQHSAGNAKTIEATPPSEKEAGGKSKQVTCYSDALL